MNNQADKLKTIFAKLTLNPDSREPLPKTNDGYSVIDGNLHCGMTSRERTHNSHKQPGSFTRRFQDSYCLLFRCLVLSVSTIIFTRPPFSTSLQGKMFCDNKLIFYPLLQW